MLSRAGSQFGTTLTGTLATTFLLELYFGPFGVSATEIASISAVQTTLTMILGLVMGVVPGWINTFCNYVKDVSLPFMVAAVGYLSSNEKDLVKTMQAQPNYLNVCLWILGLLLFGYTTANVLKALILKFFYNVEGEKKEQMYRELDEIRAKRHKENIVIESEKAN